MQSTSHGAPHAFTNEGSTVLLVALGGLAYLFFQPLRHLENLAYLSFQKKKSECHSLTPHPNPPPPLQARKGGLASASAASPASVPSLVLRATETSSCGLGWGGSQLRVPQGRCSKLGLDGVRVVYKHMPGTPVSSLCPAHSSNSMRAASQQQNLLSPAAHLHLQHFASHCGLPLRGCYINPIHGVSLSLPGMDA